MEGRISKDITRAGEMLVDMFDTVRVINLQHRSDRRREMAQQLQRLGLSFDHPNIRIFEARQFTDPGEFPNAGTRGCYQSHLDVLRDAADRGVGTVLIFEDDCDFDPNIEKLMPTALHALSETEWDVFFGDADIPQAGHVPCGEPIDLVPPHQGLTALHFYALRGRAIERAASFLEGTLERRRDHPAGGPTHVDGVFSVFRRLNPHLQCYLANPRLAYQRLSRTDIHQLAFYDRTPVLRSAASLARTALKKSGFRGFLLR